MFPVQILTLQFTLETLGDSPMMELAAIMNSWSKSLMSRPRKIITVFSLIAPYKLRTFEHKENEQSMSMNQGKRKCHHVLHQETGATLLDHVMEDGCSFTNV